MLFTVTQSGYGGDVTGRKRDIDYLQGEIQELFADLWQVPGFAGLRRGFRPQSDCFRSCRSSATPRYPRTSGMTGEITLTGHVLPIGGVREKVLAAQRAGLKRVILPSENEPELEELPAETRRELDFVLVDSIEQVFDVAFDGAGNGTARPALIGERQAAAKSR